MAADGRGTGGRISKVATTDSTRRGRKAHCKMYDFYSTKYKIQDKIQNTGKRAKYLGGKYPETLEKKLWTKYMIVADTAHKLSGKLQDKIWGGQNTQDRTGVYGRDSRSQCGTLVTSRVRCRPRATSFSHAAAALVTRPTLVGWRCPFKLLQGSCSVLQFDDLRVEYTNWRWS